MSGVVLEVTLVLVLIVLNGIFAMSEIAVVSSRRARLQQRAERGDAGARRALELAEHPNRFLSTVQIGITTVGIFAGAYGGATLAGELGVYLDRIPTLAGWGERVALVLVVLVITYLSLVVGELVPKRIGLNHPERIASRVARPMHALSVAAAPLVRILSFSTDSLLRLLGFRKADEPPVTEAEVSALLEQGTDAGVFEEEEQELVERVFWLGDQRAGALMTPRLQVAWVDINDPPELQRASMMRDPRTRYLVCDDEIDHVVGMVESKDLWAQVLGGGDLDLRKVLRKPLFVPEAMRALRLLEAFRESGVYMAVVLDEYAGVEGVVTLNDVLEGLAGDLVETGQPRVVQREDGSWLVDASLGMDEFRDALDLPERRGDERDEYRTLGGFVVTTLGRIPRAGEWFVADRLRYEVVDMDGHRVDKVLVSRVEGGER
jgi:putative hemolysin